MNTNVDKMPERVPIKAVYLKEKKRWAAVLICYHCGQPMLGKWRSLWFGDPAGKSCDAYFMHNKCKEPFVEKYADKGLWFSRSNRALGYITWPTRKELAKRDEKLSKIKAPPKKVYVVRETSGKIPGKVIAITKSRLRAHKKQHMYARTYLFSIADLEEGAIEDDPYVDKWLALRKKKIQEMRRRKMTR